VGSEMCIRDSPKTPKPLFKEDGIFINNIN
jgi:hypothetical protein